MFLTINRPGFITDLLMQIHIYKIYISLLQSNVTNFSVSLLNSRDYYIKYVINISQTIYDENWRHNKDIPESIES